MEKISSIVPRSRRVSATDLSAAAPVRPGVPGFGRPMGSSTIGEKDLRTTAQKAMAAQNRMNEERRQSAITPEIVTDMTDRFFLKKTVAAPEAPALIAPPVMAPIGEVAVSIEGVAMESDEDIHSAIIEENITPQEYVPPGTYLDVSA